MRKAGNETDGNIFGYQIKYERESLLVLEMEAMKPCWLLLIGSMAVAQFHA